MTHPYTRLYRSITAPTVDEDNTLGYEIGDIIVDRVANQSYQAFDVTTGAAVWVELTGSGGGGGASDWGDLGGTLSDQIDLQAALNAKLDENTPITGATKTKITYDADGLVTAGADVTTADIADSTNKRYVTDADLTDIGNLSGVNTGDQDLSGKQPIDADLTAIAALSPANDDIIQRKAGAWTFRTVAQYVVDLGLGAFAFISSLAHSSLAGIGANDHHAQNHAHNATDAQKLTQANSHQSPDTDVGTSSLHHTIGAGSNQSAAGDHAHAGLQLLDADLTAIAAIAPANDDIIQRKAGAWINRTLAQLITDLTEQIQDIVGGMIGVETGIDVAYDDTGGKLDFAIDENQVGAFIQNDYAIPHSGWIGPNGLGTWSYVSADAPTFVANVPDSVAALMSVGWRWKLTQTTTKYFIVTAKGSPSGGFTPVTIYGGTDYVLANAAISSQCFSPAKSPLGFPLDPSKWTVTVTDTSDRTQSSPVAATWYNLGSISISIPIGVWRISYKVLARVSRTASTTTNQFSTLSTANNSQSDASLTTITTIGGASGTLIIQATQNMAGAIISLAAKNTYYLNASTGVGATDIAHRGDNGATVIKAECAYL